MTRLAFIHTGAVVIPTISSLAAAHLPGVETHHLLDDKIVADLGRDAEGSGVRDRLRDLVHVAQRGGAKAVMFSCSSISGFAAGLQTELGLPVLRIDEAMADEAVRLGQRVAVLATLPTTLTPTVALLRERAEAAGRSVEVAEVLIEGAFEAVSGGDRDRHDALVAEAITARAGQVDVVVLAQASMASAAETVSTDVPVLTSPELGVRRAASLLT
ncbi:MAG TPA: aspartate/glutamate racemase family protein [Candidatus Ruania gallistercoris]|uniref:Aspartate/glutamate racemase family protein n=1 Tax=Candidatus Ruania gallistercoris TaxID=2838746 RepID=A0A9D2J5P0_9MICO|nr:aspartate/glutamate racemase family protein [Candidatus Ruania gallistercoris]